MSGVEMAALACALGDELAAIDLVAGCREHWFTGVHRQIFAAIRAAVTAGRPVDAVTITANLPGVAERIQQIADMSSSNSPRMLGEYVATIRKNWMVREINALGRDATSPAPADPDEWLGQLGDRLGAIAADRPVDSLVDAQTLAKTGWERASATRDASTMVPTGFADLDIMIGGFQPGRLYLVGARPGQGKSGLLFGWAEDMSRHGVSTMGFSLEMPVSEVSMRMACRRSGVSLHKANAGKLNLDDLGRMRQAFDAISNLPLWVDDKPGISLSELVAVCRRKLRAGQRGAIVIDYLQLMSPNSKDETRDQQIGAITRGLKGLAKTLGVPILLASQLNREVEKRDSKRPQLSDLRESGSIEQDADVVMFLFREDTYGKPAGSPSGMAELIVAKNRSGPTGTIKLKFDPQTVRFSTP